MPSDLRVTRALDALALPIERYRSAIAMTLEHVDAVLSAGVTDSQARAERLREQLGPFAGARIDPARLATFLGQPGLDALAMRRLERAASVLRDLQSCGTELFCVNVEAGADFGAVVGSQLATIGRAFAAARIVATAHGGDASSSIDEDVALEGFAFSCWNTAERNLAPPLVVRVDGRDLTAGVLSAFVDGAQKFVLIVDGPSAPAPLVRLITPGILVIQAHDIAEAVRIADWPAAAVLAVLPDSAVSFVHDPSAGPETWQRLSICRTGNSRVIRVGGLSAAQQKEELRQLDALSTAPSAGHSTAADPVASVAPAERVAAWLLQQAELAPPAAGD